MNTNNLTKDSNIPSYNKDNQSIKNTSQSYADPFDEPLVSQEDTIELSDEEIAAAPSPIIFENMNFSYLKPPYMLFEDQAQTKRKLLEAYTQHEFLLLYGYSGCGKTVYGMIKVQS